MPTNDDMERARDICNCQFCDWSPVQRPMTTCRRDAIFAALADTRADERKRWRADILHCLSKPEPDLAELLEDPDATG